MSSEEQAKQILKQASTLAELLRQSQKAIDDLNMAHAHMSYSLGVYFGFPHCCRLQFANDVAEGKSARERVINGSGFIPCTEHYLLIKAGSLKLEDLIKDRVCPRPFENEQEDPTPEILNEKLRAYAKREGFVNSTIEKALNAPDTLSKAHALLMLELHYLKQ